MRSLERVALDPVGAGLSLVFVTHDLPLVRHLAHRVVVVQGGQVVDLGQPVLAALSSRY